jgi:hypothetical protein
MTMIMQWFFFSGSNLCCKHNANDILENLARFGYKLNMKVIFFLSYIFGYMHETCIKI